MEGDTRWEMSCPRPEGRKTLTLRHGFRACRTVKRGALAGRTFEFWVEPLQAPNEPGLHGGPLWVGRELKAMGALRAEGPRIMGRRPGQASTPAALWNALSAHCASETRVRDSLAWCGLLHPSVQALLDVAAAPLPRPSLEEIAARAAAIGSRRDGLRGLREGGSQLRLIGQIAGEAFLLAMKAISQTEPELVFEQLLRRKEFQLTWLPEDLRKGLSKASMLVHMVAASLGWPGLAGAWPSALPQPPPAVWPYSLVQEARTEQLLQLPFMQGFAKVYHELPSWQAKRKHLSMFAPYFPYEARSTTRLSTLALTQT